MLTVISLGLESELEFINFVAMDTKALVSLLSEHLERRPDEIETLIDGISEIIITRIKDGDMVSSPGFGQFEPKMKPERVTSHPSSGKKILVPPKLSMVFKPSALLKQKVRN